MQNRQIKDYSAEMQTSGVNLEMMVGTIDSIDSL
jgi:hypothetical protein